MSFVLSVLGARGDVRRKFAHALQKLQGSGAAMQISSSPTVVSKTAASSSCCALQSCRRLSCCHDPHCNIYVCAATKQYYTVMCKVLVQVYPVGVRAQQRRPSHPRYPLPRTVLALPLMCQRKEGVEFTVNETTLTLTTFFFGLVCTSSNRCPQGERQIVRFTVLSNVPTSKLLP
jgi:hypothetical protein